MYLIWTVPNVVATLLMCMQTKEPDVSTLVPCSLKYHLHKKGLKLFKKHSFLQNMKKVSWKNIQL